MAAGLCPRLRGLPPGKSRTAVRTLLILIHALFRVEALEMPANGLRTEPFHVTSNDATEAPDAVNQDRTHSAMIYPFALQDHSAATQVLTSPQWTHALRAYRPATSPVIP